MTTTADRARESARNVATDGPADAALVVLLRSEPPRIYLIPSEAWTQPNALLVSRDYAGLKEQAGMGA
jgi:hypothetical protein